ncbi:hypothetical protein BASA50_000983 [Batrachochytrium salamandrivorans]|uniref:NAD(P)-binding protein n=1 Tax=Batrachochytrium salamandrivorans TaxID=1357716 RepID=A0ABQ8ESD4_9FUNG|nr:hypothetical protein BASA60_001587 [Batrachochytrium salamandrivorans]KAH6585822.1 hypothetical protein BASA50_000983 [Batrachochytrium salamandrivorans]KAH6598415.1 hypothetical protein BASA61_002868 [Batrachochytrium salamandrivorans]KAH9269449.1 hypothetical protein BASA83_008532 [Batrachochytrium salamandrivorans]KAJ1341869.1 hypothetical protein BSLG_003522 [Batrachochytrium salamandrivorans]
MPSNPTHFAVSSIPDLAGRVYIVTGGNSGIGYETCLELSKKGAHVFMASRSEERAAAAIKLIKETVPSAKVEFLNLQLADLKQVRSAAEAFLAKGYPLDVLVNNAGIMASPFKLSVDGIEEQFATNHMGHFLFTTMLMPALLKVHEVNGSDPSRQPRVVNISSEFHRKVPLPEGIRFDRINDPADMSVLERYGQSKLCNILFSKGLNKRFGDKVFINSVHPGFVKTDLTRGVESSYGSWIAPIMDFVKYFAALSPQDGALTQLYVSTSPDIVSKGIKDAYFIPIAHDSPSNLTELAKSADLADKLWDYSEKLVKEKLAVV